MICASSCSAGLQGVVFRAALDRPAFVVKVIDLDTEELPIYERLLRVSDIRLDYNHTVPSEIYRDGHPLLMMPYLNTLTSLLIKEGCTLDRLLDIFYQLVEVRSPRLSVILVV